MSLENKPIIVIRMDDLWNIGFPVHKSVITKQTWLENDLSHNSLFSSGDALTDSLNMTYNTKGCT